MNASDTDDTERRILETMKDILTRVARETATPPGTRHVLSDDTIDRIRECLSLINTRQMALSDSAREISTLRPRYPGQSTRAGEARVRLDSITCPDGTKKR